MGDTELGDYLALQQRQNEEDRRQLTSGSILTYFLFTEETMTGSDLVGVKVRSIAGDSLIWGNPNFGIWNTQKWNDVSTNSFVLGNTVAASLGTNKLGNNSGSWVFHASGNI